MNEKDSTIRLPRPAAVPSSVQRGASVPLPPAARRRLPVLAGAVVVAAAAAGLVWFLTAAPDRQEPPPKPEDAAPAAVPAPAPPPALAPRPLPAAAEIGPPMAGEGDILAHRATRPTLFRLGDDPHVFVADFPDLDSQGAAFNRVAALLEKVGQPRDRVLDDAALAEAIARTGDTPGTYYYGHNYRGRDLEHFFALAERDRIVLTPQETWLREQVARIRRLLPAAAEFAIVSVPGREQRVDEAMRAAILHHELGHGHFFTNPRFQAHVERVWREAFTEPEREGFRAFLRREGYDPAIEEVMINEAMAYLLYTPDARFFTPAHAGLSEARAEELRARLREGAPR